MHMSYAKVHSLTTYHLLLVEFGKFLIELHALKLIVGFHRRLTDVSPSWLVSKTTTLSRHLAKHGFNT